MQQFQNFNELNLMTQSQLLICWHRQTMQRYELAFTFKRFKDKFQLFSLLRRRKAGIPFASEGEGEGEGRGPSFSAFGPKAESLSPKEINKGWRKRKPGFVAQILAQSSVERQTKGTNFFVIEPLPARRVERAPSPSLSEAIFFSHANLWEKTVKINLHITSKKLLYYTDLYSAIHLAFCCFGNQSPQMIKSKKAVAAFKIMKNIIIGAKIAIRRQNKYYFFYKWGFLAASLPVEFGLQLDLRDTLTYCENQKKTDLLAFVSPFPKASYVTKAKKKKTTLWTKNNTFLDKKKLFYYVKKEQLLKKFFQLNSRETISNKNIHMTNVNTKTILKPIMSVSVGIQNIFLFPELDRVDYVLFEPIPGLDLTFHYK
jgi:hypothetical protein